MDFIMTLEEIKDDIENSIYTYPLTHEKQKYRKYTIKEIVEYSTICYEMKYNNSFYTVHNNTVHNIFGGRKSYHWFYDCQVCFDSTTILLSTGIHSLDEYNFECLEDIFHMQLVLSTVDIHRLYVAKKFLENQQLLLKQSIVLDISNIKYYYFKSVIHKKDLL